MHNLLLGTAKYMMSDESLISKSDYQNMQDTVDRIRVPVNIGRIPHKVESQVSSLTADQWKNQSFLSFSRTVGFYTIIAEVFIPHISFYWG